MSQNRREFLASVAAAGAALPFVSGLGSLLTFSSENNYPVHLFSKPLDNYDFAFMCECISRAGIPGIDLTIRKGGKVEPETVENDLPMLVAEARKFNLVLDMMVSGIVSASDPYTERVLKTASASGIKNYRLGWFNYDFKLGIWESVLKYKNIVKEINDLNQKYNIIGSYQNHDGLYVGAQVWDLNEMLRDLPSGYTGIQYDVRHAMVEGAHSWITGMYLVSGYFKTLAIKDFVWRTENGKSEAITVPLGEGIVDWDLYFRTVKELNIKAPVTLHVEYPLLAEGEENFSLSKQQEIIVQKLKKDSDFLSTYLAKYQLI
jgi:L-ribulose-5-phosphate 3-epimerase